LKINQKSVFGKLPTADGISRSHFTERDSIWNKRVVYLLSCVLAEVRFPICWTSSMVWWFYKPACGFDGNREKMRAFAS